MHRTIGPTNHTHINLQFADYSWPVETQGTVIFPKHIWNDCFWLWKLASWTNFIIVINQSLSGVLQMSSRSIYRRPSSNTQSLSFLFLVLHPTQLETRPIRQFWQFDCNGLYLWWNITTFSVSSHHKRFNKLTHHTFPPFFFCLFGLKKPRRDSL